MNDKHKEKATDRNLEELVEINNHEKRTAVGGYAPSKQRLAVQGRQALVDGGLHIIDVDI